MAPALFRRKKMEQDFKKGCLACAVVPIEDYNISKGRFSGKGVVELAKKAFDLQ